MKWLERIDKAEKRGYFCTTERHAAKSWNSCAVGECNNGLSRQFLGRNLGMVQIHFQENPKIIKLFNLGLDFPHYICTNNFIEARATFKEIQELANQIKSEAESELVSTLVDRVKADVQVPIVEEELVEV